MNNPNPPERAERLVKWSLAPWERPAVTGDLHEEFRDLAETAGEPAARRWYWRQAIESVWPNLTRRLKVDERRRSRWHQGLAGILLGCTWFVQGRLFSFLKPSDATFIGTAWIAGGMIIALNALLRKRVQPAPRQATLEAGFLLLFLALGVVGLFFFHSPNFAAAGYIAGLLAGQAWPWRPKYPPRQDFVVGFKDAERTSRATFTFTVPNTPLGLSGLRLSRAMAGAVAEPTPRTLFDSEPTIYRGIDQTEAIRLRAAVNLPATEAEATVDVVDAAGRIARRVRTPIIPGSLVQLPATPDDIADDDPAEHFGQVDVTLPLAGLAPGPYCLRLTATDTAHTSRQEESIVVRDGSGRRGR